MVLLEKKTLRTPKNVAHVEQSLAQSLRECEISLSAPRLIRIINMQDFLKLHEIVSVQNPDSAVL
jgi:hypothetical protein